MNTSVHIGTWHEKESRDLTEHTSYAADWILHKTIAGDYPVYLGFEGGYLIPIPYWILFGIKSEVVDGGLYSGFGGVNFACDKPRLGANEYRMLLYSYQIPDLIKIGKLTLLPEWEWLNQEHGRVLEYVKTHNITWEYLAKYKEAK